jgi:hypothetical protein
VAVVGNFKKNYPLKNQLLISYIIILLISSCKEKKNDFEKQDRLIKDSTYVKANLIIEWNEFREEEVEIYISKNNDTIYNQYRITENGILDSINSMYYKLKIRKSDREGFYKANISFHSKYELLELDEQNKRTLTFYYLEQKADKIYDSISSKTTTVFNSLEFEFENQYDNRLVGLLSQVVIRDTILNGEKAFNYRQSYLLVDNYPVTDNIFLEAYEFEKDNKFNPYGINLEKIK